MAGPRRLWLLASVPLALGLWLALRTERASPRVEVAAAAPLAGQRPDAGLEPLDDLGYGERAPRAVPLSAGGGPTARSFLAEHYGSEWDTIQARMEAAGVDLDVPYVHHPWEEAEPLIREQYRLGEEERAALIEQQLRWPSELTVDEVRRQFATGRAYPLAPEDLPLIRDLVADLNLELLARAELWSASIDVCMQDRFQRGLFVRMPFTNKGLDDSRGFYAKGVGGLGWATGLVLTREEYPDLAALEREMIELRRQRYERVVRFLHGRMPR